MQASDIAVLVRRNVAGEQIRDALAAAGIPAVLHGSDSVFSSLAARDWLRVLQALEQPRQALVREAALTSLVGWTFPRLVQADETALADLSYDFRRWSRTLAFRGVAALLETMGTDTALSERVLARPDGERLLTDLRHIAQRLHAQMTGRQLGVAGLREWLAEAIEVAVTDDVTEGLRRLATDAAAVQVLTLHRSKGLEFPVVYLPEAWDCFVPTDERDAVLRLHEDGTEVLDVGGRQAAGRPDRFRRSLAEEAGENLRLNYVGMTRAQCQVVTWWADARTTTTSALHRFWARPARVGDPDPSYPATLGPAQEPVPRSAQTVVGDPGRVLSVEEVQPRPPTRRRAGAAVARRPGRPAVRAGPGHRLAADVVLVADRRRPRGGPGRRGRQRARAGEGGRRERRPARRPRSPRAPPVQPSAAAELLSPMRDLPSGVDFGTAVHAVLEVLDPTADDLAAATLAATTDALSRLPHGDLTPETLAEALLPSLATPLGPLADDRSLAELSPADRLCELVFELPLAGGDRPRADVRLGDLAPRAGPPPGGRRSAGRVRRPAQPPAAGR